MNFPASQYRRGDVVIVRFPFAEGRQSGLLGDSAVACENLFTVRQDIVTRKIGSLPDAVMEKVNRCLKAALGID